MYTASIYFLGQYRPAYFEADTARKAVAKAIQAINEVNEPDYGWFASRLNELLNRIKMERFTSSSAEHGCRGVALTALPHDPWLDDVTRKMPTYPGLDYAGAANV